MNQTAKSDLRITPQVVKAVAPHASVITKLNVGRFLADARSRFALLVVFAFAIRAPFFGNWAYNVDDQYYALVGQRMLDGATLYVDVWDRKGPLLYLVFTAIAAVSRTALAYHVAATLFAIAGAWGISCIAQRTTGARGAMMAGIAYLALLNQFAGETAQSPVLYNPLMIAGAWAIVTRLDFLKSGRIDGRIVGGMALVGLAIGMKQTAAIEAAWFGSFITFQLWRAQCPTRRLIGQVTLLALVGAAPYLLTAAWYLASGHFSEFWHAIIASSFRRGYQTAFFRIVSIVILGSQMLLVIIAAGAGIGILRQEAQFGDEQRFLLAWLMAATLGMFAYPNIGPQYALPLMAPLCIFGACFFMHSRTGVVFFSAIIAISLVMSQCIDIAGLRAARHTVDQFTQYVREETPHHRLFVWGKPGFVYTLADSPPPRPLAYPAHLYDGAESGASGIDEVSLMRGLLAAQPETVVYQLGLIPEMTNPRTTAMINAYVPNCHKYRSFPFRDDVERYIVTVYSECAGPQKATH